MASTNLFPLRCRPTQVSLDGPGEKEDTPNHEGFPTLSPISSTPSPGIWLPRVANVPLRVTEVCTNHSELDLTRKYSWPIRENIPGLYPPVNDNLRPFISWESHVSNWKSEKKIQHLDFDSKKVSFTDGVSFDCNSTLIRPCDPSYACPRSPRRCGRCHGRKGSSAWIRPWIHQELPFARG